jgi:hypothetical protein
MKKGSQVKPSNFLLAESLSAAEFRRIEADLPNVIFVVGVPLSQALQQRIQSMVDLLVD